MKKLLLISLLLFIAAGFCFAKTNVIEEDTFSSNSIMLNIGGTYYGTKRLSDFSSPVSVELSSRSFVMEIGTFKSDEDGLIDLVSADLFGWSTGKVNSEGFNFYRDALAFKSMGDAKHFNLYGKDTFGVQVNAFVFSAGLMVGPKYGFDRMTQTAYSEFNENFKFAENRIFLDFNLNPYISVNLFHTVKIFMKTDLDFPIFRIRFIDHTREGYKSDTVFKWDWFKNDIPVSYMAGVAVFF